MKSLLNKLYGILFLMKLIVFGSDEETSEMDYPDY